MTINPECKQRPIQILFDNWNKQMARNCMCYDCCHVRGECNSFLMSLPIHVSETLNLKNNLTKCPNGSTFLERNQEWVKETEKQMNEISELCKSITDIFEKPLEKYR